MLQKWTCSLFSKGVWLFNRNVCRNFLNCVLYWSSVINFPSAVSRPIEFQTFSGWSIIMMGTRCTTTVSITHLSFRVICVGKLFVTITYLKPQLKLMELRTKLSVTAWGLFPNTLPCGKEKAMRNKANWRTITQKYQVTAPTEKTIHSIKQAYILFLTRFNLPFSQATSCRN